MLSAAPREIASSKSDEPGDDGGDDDNSSDGRVGLLEKKETMQVRAAGSLRCFDLAPNKRWPRKKVRVVPLV